MYRPECNEQVDVAFSKNNNPPLKVTQEIQEATEQEQLCDVGTYLDTKKLAEDYLYTETYYFVVCRQ